MPSNKRVTLKVIAERAGTSIGTVDRALKGREGVRGATKAKVLEIARELGYLPNPNRGEPLFKPSIRIGLIYPEQPAPFFNPMAAGIDAAVRDLSALGVQADHIRYSMQKQDLTEPMLQKLYGGSYRGVAVNYAGPRIARQIDRLADDGLPVITFNTDAPNSKRRFFVGNDSVRSGRMGAALLGRFLGGQGAVTVLGNYVQTAPFSQHFAGFCETIHESFPGMTIYPCAECFADPQLAARSLITLIQNVPQIRGVFCTGYSSTVGAVEALRQLERKDIVLIGYDTSETLLQALQEGWCDALLYQNPYRQGYAAVQSLTQFLLDGTLPDPRKIGIDTQIVIPQNADCYRPL